MSESRNQCSWIDDSWVYDEHNEILIFVDVDVLDNSDNLSYYCVITCNVSVKMLVHSMLVMIEKIFIFHFVA